MKQLIIRLGAALVAITAPLNAQSDNLADATPIAALPVMGTNVGAGVEAGEPVWAGNAGGASVWYSWTATATGHYTVTLEGSSFDTLLGIFFGSGPTYPELDFLAQNDDGGAGPGFSLCRIYVETGTTLYIGIDGYNDGMVPAQTGDITLDIQPYGPGEVAPTNDFFSSPEDLTGPLPISRTSDVGLATRQIGEPFASGFAGGPSRWWTWTSTVTGDVEISLFGSAHDTLLGVYTGNALGALATVASNDDFQGDPDSRVVFPATTGTLYRIMTDGFSAGQFNPAGNVVININPLQRQSTLIPFGGSWSWLHPTDGIDPAVADPDFDTTWFASAGYDGPAFNPPSASLFGYGAINIGAITTDITTPPSGSRYSAYFRSTFNSAASPGLKADIVADDGVIIYLDGVAKGRVNIDAAAADTYLLLATTAIDGVNETLFTTVDLGPITAGAHEIAVSLHNGATTSSDLGFDMRLYTDSTPPPGDFILTAPGAGTGFEEPAIASGSYVRGANGNVELGWTSTAGSVQAPAAHPGAPAAQVGQPPASKYFRLNAQFANPLTTERLSIGGLTPAQKAGLTASIDIRTLTTSGTTFEVDDILTVTLDGSLDGTNFNVLTEILPLTTGGNPDGIIAISQATGTYATFESAAGAVTSDILYLRMSITGEADSLSEYIYLDNIRFNVPGGPVVDPNADADGDGQTNGAETFAGTDLNDPHSVLRITAVSVTGGDISLTFNSVAGKVYQIEYSGETDSAWDILRDNIASGGSTTTVNGLAPPIVGRTFVRVRVKP